MFTLDQKYLQRLIDSSPDIIIAVDRDGTIVFYNNGARTNLHFSPSEIIGQKVTRIYPTIEEARRVMDAMRQAEGGRISSFETVFCDSEHNQIPVAISGSIIYDEQGSEIGSIGFARDLRRMRRREQLATAGEIAVSLAHEINNPLETITNNLDLLTRCVESHRLDSIRSCIARVQGIVRRLDEMTRKGVYETRDYMQGKRMADLAPRESEEGNGGAHHEAAAQDWALSGMSVLVLDDDISVLTSLADVLRAERCVVHTATRPSAAFGILRNMKVEAVISDVVMPEMDGYEFYTRVKEEMPDVPVILMTAYYYDKDHIIKPSRMRGLEGAIFKKPVNPAKLRQLLAQARQKAQAAKAERVRNTPPASNPPPPAGPASTPPTASSTRG